MARPASGPRIELKPVGAAATRRELPPDCTLGPARVALKCVEIRVHLALDGGFEWRKQ